MLWTAAPPGLTTPPLIYPLILKLPMSLFATQNHRGRSITSSFPMLTETYPASQNDLCYKGIYTGVLGSNRWSGWAAAISIFALVCKIIHIVPPTVEAFSQSKSESRPVKRWDKTTSEAVVTLKDSKMGWILWLHKSKKHCLNLMYELSALPYQQEIWTHFLQLFPLANHSL